MDTQALRDRLEGSGLSLSLSGDGLRVAPASQLTDELRGLIRAHKAALVEMLRQNAEIQALLALQCPEDHPDYPEALRIALADPGAALEALREPGETWIPETRADLRRMAQEWQAAA